MLFYVIKVFKKILGLDIGQKHIGCALADFNGITIEPLASLKRESNSLCLPAIKQIVKKHFIKKIVIGYPLTLDNKMSSSTKKVKGFIKKLQNHLEDVEIQAIHEGLSSWASKANFPHLHLRKSTTPVNIDSFAAREILQTYFYQQTIKNRQP